MAVADPTDPNDERESVFDAVGGEQAFHDLVEDFYGKVESDELLRPIYPEELEPGKTHLALFLAQYFGGPSIYSDKRGHPRLRKRHGPFEITPKAAQRWEKLMSQSIREQGWREDAERAVLNYVEEFTKSMVNTLPPIHERT